MAHINCDRRVFKLAPIAFRVHELMELTGETYTRKQFQALVDAVANDLSFSKTDYYAVAAMLEFNGMIEVVRVSECSHYTNMYLKSDSFRSVPGLPAESEYFEQITGADFSDFQSESFSETEALGEVLAALAALEADISDLGSTEQHVSGSVKLDAAEFEEIQVLVGLANGSGREFATKLSDDVIVACLGDGSVIIDFEGVV